MDSLVLTGRHWEGYKALRYLFVFGASFCDVGYDSECPHPTKAEPLGVPFPGITYAGDGKPNWVGYIAREFCPSGSGDTDPLLVFDYAKGGAIVDGVRSQVYDQFIKSVAKKPSWAPWSAEDSLFSISIGVNDVARGCDPAESVDNLFKIIEELYKHGARNFLFFNTPPVLRAPISRRRKKASTARQDPYRTWNTILRSDACGFVREHPDVSAIIFSLWNLFNEVLDDPVTHGFDRGDPDKPGGGIWFDRLHPTTDVHRLIAQSVRDFLSGVKQNEGVDDEDVEVVFGETNI
ncbi:hypothetical protein ACEPAF_4329 [Sanghuangporus sanghuang]